ncbi:MAG: hypothetical protein ABSD20_05365 [Terriglobales bacterium]|jgi:hypothetical protein
MIVWRLVEVVNLGWRGLPSCDARKMLLELPDHALKVGIPSAQASREPVAAALGDLFAVSDHLELSSLAGCGDHFNVEALLD